MQIGFHEVESKSDRDVIESVLSGRKDDFQYLVKRYENIIFRLIIRQVGDRHASLDLAQETFVRAFVNLKAFRFEASFSTWLTRIAINITHSYFASKHYRKQKLTAEFDEVLTEYSNQIPQTDATTFGIMKDFQVALGILRAEYREVIVLCGIERRSYEEVSTILDIPVGTVKSRLNKARLLLRKELEK